MRVKATVGVRPAKRSWSTRLIQEVQYLLHMMLSQQNSINSGRHSINACTAPRNSWGQSSYTMTLAFLESSLVCMRCIYMCILKVCISIKWVEKHQNCIKNKPVLHLKRNVSVSQAIKEVSRDHTYHSPDSSRFLYSESLDHLEHIHHSLCLTPLNGGGYGTEHTWPAHCITVERQTQSCWRCTLPISHLQWTTTGLLPVRRWILLTSAMASVILMWLEQRPSGVQLVMCSW